MIPAARSPFVAAVLEHDDVLERRDDFRKPLALARMPSFATKRTFASQSRTMNSQSFSGCCSYIGTKAAPQPVRRVGGDGPLDAVVRDDGDVIPLADAQRREAAARIFSTSCPNSRVRRPAATALPSSCRRARGSGNEWMLYLEDVDERLELRGAAPCDRG